MSTSFLAVALAKLRGASLFRAVRYLEREPNAIMAARAAAYAGGAADILDGKGSYARSDLAREAEKACETLAAYLAGREREERRITDAARAVGL